jgi:hypothetical protein
LGPDLGVAWLPGLLEYALKTMPGAGFVVALATLQQVPGCCCVVMRRQFVWQSDRNDVLANLPQIRRKVRLQCMVLQLQRATTRAGLLCAPDKYC